MALAKITHEKNHPEDKCTTHFPPGILAQKSRGAIQMAIDGVTAWRML